MIVLDVTMTLLWALTLFCLGIVFLWFSVKDKDGAAIFCIGMIAIALFMVWAQIVALAWGGDWVMIDAVLTILASIAAFGIGCLAATDAYQPSLFDQSIMGLVFIGSIVAFIAQIAAVVP